jgi:hypothetical protein
LKSQLLNNRLRLNTTVFRQHRSDVQIEGFNAIGSVGTPDPALDKAATIKATL